AEKSKPCAVIVLSGYTWGVARYAPTVKSSGFRECDCLGGAYVRLHPDEIDRAIIDQSATV
ncbi:MAG: hypothetical protein ACOYL5_01490, partial [Phototrophicaceae bacterium]